MTRRGDASVTTWSDLAACVPAWEAEMGVSVAYHIHVRGNLTAGAYVEVVLYDAAYALERVELYRLRAPFPVKKATGQAGAVLHATFQALRSLEETPWSWSTAMRRRGRD